MICILMAAGHAAKLETDIREETSDQFRHLEGVPKALLPGVGGKRILDYWWNAIKTRQLFSDVYLVTNADKYKHFERWAMGADFPVANIVNNGSSLSATQRGALCDLQLVLDTKRLTAGPCDVMVVAGDMMFQDDTFDLTQVLNYFRLKRETGDLALCYQLDGQEAGAGGLRCTRGLVQVCPDTNRIQRFFEKPLWTDTPSRLASVVFYCLRHDTLGTVQEYLGQSGDGPPPTFGRYLSWLINDRQQTVYAMKLATGFQLIGDVGLADYTRWLAIFHQRHLSERRPAIRHRVNARVGLMGNPSDGFHGKTIALSIENFWAEVTISESATLRLLPHPLYDPTEFGSLHDLYGTSQKEGYLGGLRLLQATCKRFYQVASENGTALGRRNFTLRYDTNIPRQVGLAGSSAIVTAALRCLMDFYGVTEADVPRHRLPQLVLDVERSELGIQAGLQDRVVQVYGGLVYMDFSRELMESRGYGEYRYLTAGGPLPPLFLAYLADPSDSGKMHSDISLRWKRGDDDVIAGMARFAELTDAARDAICAADWETLARLMNENFELRKQLYGAAALGDLNLRMVELGKQHGAAVKFPGSGGAVVGLCHDHKHLATMREVYQQEGFVFCEVIPALSASTGREQTGDSGSQ
ncbi:glucuronokinase 1-like [Amphibalanus amphitrite]|uniref:glucuronokinase 1-like n=1 Tax=Amphibalanus amphitrite TaxID=1232801 RepID=UPI001C926EF1|nr:glucuronokinase 1-like [Amphibalanus amphitrite]XP_043195188.1 glucuronokinase 1-like [Amphibalanus amphitrite]XP_043195189.1 glucuronokinase 1-like [Amphibalanus amphitrite]